MTSKLEKEPTSKEYIEKILIKLDLIRQDVVAMHKDLHAVNERYKKCKADNTL